MNKKDKNNAQEQSSFSKRQEEFWKKVKLQQKEFEENIYPNKNREEKIFYWAGYFRQSVRSTEYGHDPALCFSKEEYNEMKSLESDIDEMLPEIFTKAHVSK